MCVLGEGSSYQNRWKKLPEKDAAKAKAARTKQTYTKNDRGYTRTICAEKGSQAAVDMIERNLAAYTEMTGKAKPTVQDMRVWLRGEKAAYKEDMRLLPNFKPTTEVVMKWLKAKRMAYEVAMGLLPNSRPTTEVVMEWLRAKRKER